MSSVFDNSKIKRLVPEFSAALPFAEGIKRSVEWFEDRPQLCTVDTDWNKMLDTLISRHGVDAKLLSYYV
ncbi:hypothetical protein D3C71_2176790 [compost metagenome]